MRALHLTKTASAVVLSLSAAVGCGGRYVLPLECPVGHEVVNGRCTVIEVPFAGGSFVMGKGYCPEATYSLLDEDCVCPFEDAPHVRSVGPFAMDATEVMRADLFPPEDCPTLSLDCLTGHSLTPDGHPVSDEAFCEAQGKALPTEAEWEFAASAGGSRTYPWGEEEPTCDRAHFDGCLPATGLSVDGFEETVTSLIHPVGELPPSPEGLFDLAGNVAERVSPDEPPGLSAEAPGYSGGIGFCPKSYYESPIIEGGSIRGGGAASPAYRLRAAHRGSMRGVEGEHLGFRCVRRL